MMTTQSTESTRRFLEEAPPLLDRAGEHASALAHDGVTALREGSRQLRERALRARDGGVQYVREEPLKSVLIAAATGAALMALFGLFTRSQGRG